MKILHIAPHMGGGIGSAYAGLGACGQDQSILLLEPPKDHDSLNRVKKAGFRILLGLRPSEIEDELREADIVLFDWYHHPAMTRFLYELPEIPIRSILWCHVRGDFFPHVQANFLRKFDQILFTTPLSMQLPQVRCMGEEYLQECCHVVYGLNDLTRFSRVERRRMDRPFTVGYVGTLNFFKLHPQFAEFCAAVEISDVRFLIVGAPSTKEEILTAAGRLGIADRLQFYGQCNHVEQVLAEMDVFGYPLNPQHSGTTENALLEAMASGLPAIALEQCAEKAIIQNGVTGFLVHSKEEYGTAIKRLYEDPDMRERFGRQARADILERFDIQKNRERFTAACQAALRTDKHTHQFKDFFAGTPADWFLSCVEDEREYFVENCAQKASLFFHELTKGSPIHYHSYFPDDERLALWSNQLLRSSK